MRSVLYTVRQLPGESANEMIDMILVSGVFDQPTRVLFMDDGVYQLISNGANAGRKDTARKWTSLPAYEIEEVFADQESVSLRGLLPTQLPDFVKIVNSNEVSEILRSADHVISD